MNRKVDGTVRCYGIADRNLTIGAVAGSSIPLVTHEPRSPEDTVDLLFYISAPEGQHGSKSHVRIRLAVIPFFPVPFHERLELVAGFRGYCVLNHLLICKVRARFNRRAGCRLCPLHKSVQDVLQCLIVSGYCSRTVHIACHRHKAVCGSGQIDLQSVFPVVDVVHGLIVGEIRTQSEESAKTCAGRTALKVGIRKEGHDRRRNIIEAPVFPYAVIDINGTDSLGNSIPDAIPAAHCIGLHSRGKVGERRRVVGSRKLSVFRVIGNLSRPALTFFELPDAERSVLFKFRRYIDEINLAAHLYLSPPFYDLFRNAPGLTDGLMQCRYQSGAPYHLIFRYNS